MIPFQKHDLVRCVGTFSSYLYLGMEMGLFPKSGVCKMLCFNQTVYKVQLVCDNDDDDDDARTFPFEYIRLMCFSIG